MRFMWRIFTEIDICGCISIFLILIPKLAALSLDLIKTHITTTRVFYMHPQIYILILVVAR